MPSIFSKSKYPQDCSDKNCVCGSHNDSNPKSNKNHNSTSKRLQIREARKLKRSSR